SAICPSSPTFRAAPSTSCRASSRCSSRLTYASPGVANASPHPLTAPPTRPKESNRMWQFLETSLQEGTPIILAALAAVFAARAGIFHLGLEGLMIIGAFASVAVTVASGSVVLGVLAAILACLAFSGLFWLVTVKLKANVIIAGLALTTVGLGATTYALEVFFATRGTIPSPAGLWQPFARTGFPMPNLSIVVLLLPVVVVVCWLL